MASSGGTPNSLTPAPLMALGSGMLFAPGTALVDGMLPMVLTLPTAIPMEALLVGGDSSGALGVGMGSCWETSMGNEPLICATDISSSNSEVVRRSEVRRIAWLERVAVRGRVGGGAAGSA